MNTATIASTQPSTNRALHIGLWVAQGLLAFAFLAAGEIGRAHV